MEQSLIGMTERQMEYYTFIRKFILTNDMSPSIYEVASNFGVCATTASRMIHKLDMRGFLHRPLGTRRTVKCLPIKGKKITREEHRG